MPCGHRSASQSRTPIAGGDQLGERVKRDTANHRQFIVLCEVAAVLDSAHLRFWLRGGWAVDFHLGRSSRTHADIDLVTWLRHRVRVHGLLQARGFAARPSPHPSRRLIMEKEGVEVNFALIEHGKKGRFVTRGWEQWPWPKGAFPNRLFEFDGLRCRAMTIDALIEEKENYGQFTGRPLRPKDRESLESLRALLARQGRTLKGRRDSAHR